MQHAHPDSSRSSLFLGSLIAAVLTAVAACAAPPGGDGPADLHLVCAADNDLAAVLRDNGHPEED